MFIRVLRDGFSFWWGKLGYSLLASIMGAVNPFFIAIVLAAIWAISGNLPALMEQLPFVLLVCGVFCPASNAWPLTLASLDMQRLTVDGEQIYYRDYFPNWLKSLRRLFLPSLALMLFYALCGFVIAFGGVFWFFSVGQPFLRWLAATIAVTGYLALLLSQWYLLPLVVSNPGIKPLFALKNAFKLLFAEPFPAFGVFLVDTVLLALLVTGRIFPFFLYFGVSFFLRIALYREVLKKYGGGEAVAETVSDSGTAVQKTAWADIMRRKTGSGGAS